MTCTCPAWPLEPAVGVTFRDRYNPQGSVRDVSNGTPMGLKVIVAQRETRHCVAQVPAMKGCSSQGATREEAGANAREAAALWLEVEQSKPTAGRAGPRD